MLVSLVQDGVTLNFTWLKDDLPLTYDGVRVSLITGVHSANVSFTSVEEGDGGIYQCRVVSLLRGLEGPATKSAYLRVTTPTSEWGRGREKGKGEWDK